MYCKIAAHKDSAQKENVMSAIKRLIADNSSELAKQYKNELQKAGPNGFANLSLIAKQNASAIKLLEKLDRSVIEELAGLVTNYKKFKESQLGSDILTISHYVFSRVKQLETKMTSAADIFKIIKDDSLKYLQGAGKPSLEQILEISREYYNDLAEQEKVSQTLAERIEWSKTGIKLLKEYGNGLAMYEMLRSPNGKGGHISLTFESNEMGHCIGNHETYTKLIGKKGHRFFSLRSLNKDGILEPHCTLSIEYGRLAQIKGKRNGNVKFPYIPAVRDFVKSLGYGNEKIPMSERNKIGYIGHSKTIDLYNLSEYGVKIHTLSLYSGDYKYIDFSRIRTIEKLILMDKFTDRDFKELSKIQKIAHISLGEANVEPKILKTLDNITETITISTLSVELINLISRLKAKVLLNNGDALRNFIDSSVKDQTLHRHKNLIADLIINSFNKGYLSTIKLLETNILKILPVEFIDLLLRTKPAILGIHYLRKFAEQLHGYENILADVIINSLNLGNINLSELTKDNFPDKELQEKLIIALNQKENMLDASIAQDATLNQHSLPGLFPGLKYIQLKN